MASQNPSSPIAITHPRNSVRPRLPAALARAITFSGTTGSTQGVRFRIAPPRKAIPSIIAA